MQLGSNVPTAYDTLSSEQLKISLALQDIYVETPLFGVFEPTLNCKITSRVIDTLELTLADDTINLLDVDFSVSVVNGDIISITYNDSTSGFYCYCEMRIDEDVDGVLPLAAGIVRGGIPDGGIIHTTIEVKSPLTLGLTGNVVELGLDYQGLQQRVEEQPEAILSINGVEPDDNGNINIKSFASDLNIITTSEPPTGNS